MKKKEFDYIAGLVALLATLLAIGLILIALLNPIASQIIVFFIGLYIIYTSLKWCKEKNR